MIDREDPLLGDDDGWPDRDRAARLVVAWAFAAAALVAWAAWCWKGAI